MYYKLYYTKVKFDQFLKNWFGARIEDKQWHILLQLRKKEKRKNTKQEVRTQKILC